jgi:hypothetical protein
VQQNGRRDLIDSPRQALSQLEKTQVHHRIAHVRDAVGVFGQQLVQFPARAFVHEQSRIDTAFAKESKVMQRQNGLATETGGRVLCDDQD